MIIIREPRQITYVFIYRFNFVIRVSSVPELLEPSLIAAINMEYNAAEEAGEGCDHINKQYRR